MAFVESGMHDLSLPVSTPAEHLAGMAKNKNRDGRGYSFEVMRAKILYTTKHKQKALQAKESPFLGKAFMTYSMGLPKLEKNYGVDLSFCEE